MSKFGPLSILVVDDHVESLSALCRLLRVVGHDAREARSMTDAFRSALNAPPDVLVSDLDLTDGDGCELLRRVRALCPSVRGIAVSGYAGRPYEQQCREAGYEVLLAKPLVFAHVLAAIDSARGNAAS